MRIWSCQSAVHVGMNGLHVPVIGHESDESPLELPTALQPPGIQFFSRRYPFARVKIKCPYMRSCRTKGWPNSRVAWHDLTKKGLCGPGSSRQIQGSTPRRSVMYPFRLLRIQESIAHVPPPIFVPGVQLSLVHVVEFLSASPFCVPCWAWSHITIVHHISSG